MPDNEPFDPKNIKKRVAEKARTKIQPTDKRAAKDNGRIPIIKSISDSLKNSEGSKRRAAQKQMRTINVETDLDIARDAAEIRRNSSRSKLAKSQREFYQEDDKTTAVAEDQGGELEYLKTKRQIERENELESLSIKGESARHKHERKINPKKKVRSKSFDEQERERLRREKNFPFTSKGPNTKRVIDEIMKDMENQECLDFTDVSTKDQEYWLRAYNDALQKDLDRGSN